VLAVVTLLVSGCFNAQSTYERRLLKTIALAEYREKLNQNLGSNWNPKKGVQIRVPKQFVEIRLPRVREDEKNKDGEEAAEEETVDPRQPDFMSVPLPGLIGAWKAEVKLTAESDGSPQKAMAYLYVLSNYDMWTRPGEGKEALKFNKSIAPNAIVDGLRAKLPEPDEWVSESHPRGEGFVEKNILTVAKVISTVSLTLPPDERPAENDNKNDVDDDANDNMGDSVTAAPRVIELSMNCKMYLAKNKDIHVLVLLIVPKQIDPRENLSLDTSSKRGSRVAMCLETLSVSSIKPPKVKSGGAGGNTGGGRGGGM
jgi:hypothetical protein